MLNLDTQRRFIARRRNYDFVLIHCGYACSKSSLKYIVVAVC